jgi:SEC-C motif-containing protein
MRSRFTAYALGNRNYLLATWDKATRPLNLSLEDGTEWTKLAIAKKQRGRPQDNKGSVEFIAYYRADNQEYALRENSRFVKKNLRWYYVDGKSKSPEKT